ncbi:uncharacterized protein LOC129766934 [Toxorhynchites rutilus septentrionalis]|uniref:uncharacterized protein LOC129766934 n=1 Tax=Toxorhynchites rutilus septentrionalis TaxID=329112 RepID=UPI00247A0C8A|nr:uncharacterized protein LOC129766934 [Toxorhynchites rutilus septentrionalis]
MPPTSSSTAKKAPSLKQLVIKLKEIQATFNDIWIFVETFKEETSASQVNVRLQKLDDLWERFGETLVDVKSHDDFVEEGDSYQKERQEFSERYYFAKSFLMDKAKDRQEPGFLDQSVRGHDASMLGTLDHVRLPQIKLQTFNGNIEEWYSFRDLFTSLIHLKSDLPEVEKFHYLKGCLQGEAKALIDALQITKANYQIAWDMLLKRYNNSKQLKKLQVKSLFKLPTLTKESTSDLQGLLEGFQRIVQTLDQVVQPGDYRDLLLVNILTSRLDSTTRRGWEEYSSTKEQDTLQDLTDFLQRRVRILESLPSKPVDKFVHQIPPAAKQKPSVQRTSYSAVQTFSGCVACEGHHPLYQCSTFQRMSVAERDTLLRKRSLCRNCFRHGHQAKECQSKYSCRHCKGRHHSLVCFKTQREGNPKSISTATPCASTSGGNEPSTSQMANVAATDSSISNTVQRCASQVLLATAIVIVEDDEGVRFPARALLDSGSESNFITEKLSQRLRVHRDRVDISVLGIGSLASNAKQRIRAKIRSRLSNFSRGMNFLVLPKVTVNIPTATVDTTGWKIPQGIELADPSFLISQPVDIILGIEFFFDFFHGGRKIALGDHLPALNDSVFGWVVCGGATAIGQPLHINCNASTSNNLESLMKQFWSCEEVGSTSNYSPEEARCEEIFTDTVQRDTNGRYTICLPKHEGIVDQLGDSKEIALRRLQATERRLARDVELKDQYTSFLTEYCRLGHMEKVTDNGEIKRCYLPHHPVVKESSSTTKVRVVFDASCKTSTNISLNDALMTGPTIQEELRSIVLRCRTKQIMVVADVEKMFRQINMHPKDRPLQSILWRASPAEDVATYELNTVTYGTRPAPFLATRTLKQLAMDEQDHFPEVAKVIIEDAYMDDIITGANNPTEVCNLRMQLESLMKSGGFSLRKWASNCPEILRGISGENLAIQNCINLDTKPSVKALGLTWLPDEDFFRFDFKLSTTDDETILTKRRILSIIATLFDPLGIIGATITTAKILMQSLWILRDDNEKLLEWDQPVPKTVGEKWRIFYKQLPLLREIKIKRCIIIPNETGTIPSHSYAKAIGNG